MLSEPLGQRGCTARRLQVVVTICGGRAHGSECLHSNKCMVLPLRFFFLFPFSVLQFLAVFLPLIGGKCAPAELVHNPSKSRGIFLCTLTRVVHGCDAVQTWGGE